MIQGSGVIKSSASHLLCLRHEHLGNKRANFRSAGDKLAATNWRDESILHEAGPGAESWLKCRYEALKNLMIMKTNLAGSQSEQNELFK
jgi:hypothetical protein